MSDAIPIRASSIASIMDCPLRGLSIQLGLVKQLPTTAPACIGSAAHLSTAAFDKAGLDGDPMSVYDASDLAEKYIKDPPEEVNWGKITEKQAINRAIGVHNRYCFDIAPKIKYDHVELTLDPLIVDCDGVDIELTGTLDRIYEGKTKEKKVGHGILDIKTGVRVLTQKPGKHKAQLGVYELLAENTLGIKMNLPGLIGQLQTSADYEVAVAEVDNAREALLGNQYQMGLLGHMAHMIKSGDWYGNSSSWLCSDKYCPLYSGCIFK